MLKFLKIYLSFIVDISIGIIFYIYNFDLIDSSSLSGLISPSSTLTFYIIHFVKILILTHLFRLISVLLFTKTLGQKIWKINYEGNIISKRLLGFIRSLFEVFTYASIVFELPRIFNQKTIAESISGTHIKKSYRKKSYKSSCLFSLFFIISVFFSPLLYRFSNLSNGKLSFSNIKKFKIENGQDFNKFHEIKSEYFKVSMFTNEFDGRYLFMPSFEVKLKSGKKKIIPILYIYDQKLKTIGSFKINKKIDLHKFFKKYRYYFDDYRLYKEIKSLLTQKTITSINEKVKKDEILFFYDLFNLNYKNIITYYNKRIYNTFSYVYLKYKMYDLLEIDLEKIDKLETDLIRLGDSDFIRLKEHNIGFENNDYIREIFYPVQSSIIPIYELSWPSTIDGALSNQLFKKYFLTQSKWSFYNNSKKEPIETNDKRTLFNAFYFIDIAFSGDSINIENILNLYSEKLEAIATSKPEQILKSLTLKIVNRLLIYAEFSKISNTSNTIIKLKELRMELIK